MKEFNSKLKNQILLASYILILAFILLNISFVTKSIKNITSILSPFFVAIGMAFVLNLPMKLFENKVFCFLDNQKSNFLRGIKRPLSILTTILTIIGLLVALILFVVPQLISSVSTLVDTIPSYVKSFESIINQYVYSNDFFNSMSDSILSTWKDWLKLAGQLLGTSLTSILNTTMNFTNSVINFVLSLVLTIYMLASKETLIRHLKKTIYAFSPKSFADKILEIGAIANITFSKFITGQCIEAVIIGTLCFIGMTVLSMPYALLISVLVGVTALIPVFGAFIGTIPSAFIILIINPMQALWFIVFIIVLQQFEGNIIYPKVVGNSVGLSAIWVMLAMLVGGSTLGLLGMLIGIPTFSVVYQLFSASTNKRLKEKNFKI